MSDCIFCKIIAGEIPASKVYEDEQWGDGEKQDITSLLEAE